jgi:hypothetical protein
MKKLIAMAVLIAGSCVALLPPAMAFDREVVVVHHRRHYHHRRHHHVVVVAH